MIRPSSCPVCRRAVQQAHGRFAASFPFCSERCRQVDLARWSDGKYAIVDELDPVQLALEMEAEQNRQQS